MSEKLKIFLQAEDLDDLQSAKNKLGDLEEEDIALIHSILQQWQNLQAVSNLLFHPCVIPEAIRVNSLLHGLADQENRYNVLAATVGLQEIDPEPLSDEDIAQIRKRLLDIIETNETILAARASVSILPFLSEYEIDRVFRFLSHPVEAVRHNILGWLYENAGFESREAFIATATHHVLPETLAWVSETLQEHDRRVTAGQPSTLGLPLYTYIPNLNRPFTCI
jgi:hypothetical protein